MRRPALRWLSLAVVLGGAAGMPAPAQITTLPPARFVKQRQMLLTYATRGSASVERVSVYVSTDGGRTWAPIEHEPAGAGTLRVKVEQEGRHDFFLVLENAAGASSPPPDSGTAPHVSVHVDSLPPTLQVHRAVIERGAEALWRARIELALIEEHLAKGGLRLFYRSQPNEGWSDAGAGAFEDGILIVELPAALADELVDDRGDGLGSNRPARVAIRVVATDLAGNRAFDECEAPVGEPPDRAADTAPAATTQPASDHTASDDTARPGQPATAHAGPKAFGSDSLSADPSADSPPAAAAATGASGETDLLAAAPGTPLPLAPDVQALREAARAFMDRGQNALAAARLAEALERAPEHPDLLVDLAQVKVSARDVDAAGELYERVLAGDPEHLAALEGLALVSARRRDYPRARGLLEQYLRLDPQSADMWLNYGDLLHRSGDPEAAQRAWQRVLKVDADVEARERAHRRLRYLGG